jgi:hypothetical protein
LGSTTLVATVYRWHTYFESTAVLIYQALKIKHRFSA